MFLTPTGGCKYAKCPQVAPSPSRKMPNVWGQRFKTTSLDLLLSSLHTTFLCLCVCVCDVYACMWVHMTESIHVPVLLHTCVYTDTCPVCTHVWSCVWRPCRYRSTSLVIFSQRPAGSQRGAEFLWKCPCTSKTHLSKAEGISSHSSQLMHLTEEELGNCHQLFY